MKAQKTSISVFKLAAILLVLGGMIVFAATNETFSRALKITRPDVKIQISAVVERGDGNVPIEKVNAVHAGEVLDWKISSVNEGNAAAENYRVVGQVPEGSVFVAGSVRCDRQPTVTYSIDGGKDYSADPMIDETQPDGSVKKVPAPVSMYTHLKFEWNAPLAANDKIDAAYRVRVE